MFTSPVIFPKAPVSGLLRFPVRRPLAGLAASALFASCLTPLGSTAWAGPAAPAEASVIIRSTESLSLEASGDASLAEGKTAEAVRQYAAALSQLPPGVESTRVERGVLVLKYTTASCDLAEEFAERGEYTKAKQALTAVLADNVSPKDQRATQLLAHIGDADRHNPALSPEQVARVSKVRKLFILAQGQVDAGAFDAADNAYNQILAIDPTNTGARRGLERVGKLINDHLRAARDDTRARMINEVDRQWESQVPMRAPLAKVQGTESLTGATDDGQSTRRKLETLVLPRLALSEAPIDEVLNYLSRKAAEADVEEADPARKGVNIIFNSGGKAVAEFKTVTLDVRNSTLGEALRSVGDQTGTRFSTDGNTVTVTPLGQGSRVITRQFRVPPGFLAAASTTTAITGDGASQADPFAAGGDKIDKVGAGLKVRKISAKEFLEQSGVPFPEGTSASYLAGNNLLLVRNTEDNLAMVATLVEGLSSGEQRQVLVRVILLKSEQRNLEELGYDWLLGAANLGSNGTFFSGGTAGNVAGNPAQAANFAILDPTGATPVGGNPITAGLRGAFDLQTTPTIDDLLASGTSGASLTGARTPGLASLANVFGDPQFQMIIRGLNQKKGIDLTIANTLILKAGQRAAASSLRTILVPTEFDPPQIPQTFGETNGGSSFPVTPTTPQSFEPKETGSSLEVEATVSDDGHTVDLNLNAIFREFDGFINFGTPITNGEVVLTENSIFQPVMSDTNINVSPQVYDGATITLGGLSSGKYEMIDDKVPLLGDIPFFGRFFKSTVRQTTRKAVIYFVTVKVIDPAGVGVSEAAALAESAESQAP